MAEKSTENNMAVTSNAQYPGQSGRVGTVREDPVDNPPPSTSKAGSDNAPKKKSTFKIINITKGSAGDADGDSIGDDLDESHTDDLMSEMADNSKASDLDQDAVLTPDEVVSREKPESRFRVVKIETKEPFRRGRWLCYDFLDTPTHNERSESKAHAHDESKTATLTGSGHFPQGFDESVRSHPHTVTSGTNVQQQDGKGGGGHHPKTYGHPSQNGSVQQGNPMTNVPSQQANAVHPDRQSEGTSTMNQYPGQMSQPYTGGQMPHQQEQTAHQMPMSNIPANAHGIPNMQQGNIHPVPVMTQGQGSMHLTHNVLATQAPMSQPYPVTPQAYQPPITQVGMMMPMMTGMMTGGVDQLSYSQAPMGPLQTVYSSSQQDPRQGDPRVNASMPPVYSSNPPDLRVTSALGTGQVPTDGSEAHTPGGMVNSDGIGKEAVRPDTLRLAENSMEDGSSQSAQQPALLTPLVTAVGTGTPANAEQQESASRPPEVAESDSGSSSTVAIDNKIEQAMDLVKTHLMFAVREEVEVLKEQIKELMERIGNLEWENSYLRANVPPEVLTRMAQTPRSLPSSSSS